MSNLTFRHTFFVTPRPEVLTWRLWPEAALYVLPALGLLYLVVRVNKPPRD